MSWRVNALKFLNILPFTNYRSKHLWITDTFNISLAQEAAGVSYPRRPQDGNNESLTKPRAMGPLTKPRPSGPLTNLPDRKVR